ncbi:MAG: hypothetical protein ACKOEO_09265, partial [Planctomycetaceae bacterium]
MCSATSHLRRPVIAVLLTAVVLASGCQQQPSAAPTATVGRSSEATSKPPLATSVSGLRFVDHAASRGLSFEYQNGAQGQALMVESIGGGAGWLDVDRDELPDVFFVQGGSPL